MAESFVSAIADSLLGKLASYAYEEASGAYAVHQDLHGIHNTLSIVRGLILDAEEKKHQQRALREWLRQVRNICSDAEDVFDGFELQDKRKQVIKASGSSISMKVGHFFSSSNPLAFRFRMAHQIKEIRNKLDKVAADGTKFGLVKIDVDPGLVILRREMTHSHVDASRVIGRENDREEIIKLLMQPHPHGDKSLRVIPIVGIGGLGKTTLAKLMFNDKRMDDLFKLKMWVCVSDDFDIRQIIIKIINSASASTFASTPTPAASLAYQEDISNLDIEQLLVRLRHKLSGQNFLLVLDDVWNRDRAKWIELKDLIKVGAIGSKIMVTTRDKSIASTMGTVPPYVLEGLSAKNCLSLFVKWAFEEGGEDRYPDLMDIGKDIVKKCGGVPLAVRTLGSSLFSKFELSTWIDVRDDEIWNLEQNKNDILPALKLSYDQMPSYLKQCFAYFSLYPRGRYFRSDETSHLWVALGLVQSNNGSERLANVARKYMDELNSRSFLQDFEDCGPFYLFRVHDLIHDLAVYVAKEEFIAVESRSQKIPELVRHFSIVENVSHGHALFPKSRCVRTIIFPIKGVGLDSEALLDRWVSRYKYLRVLDLVDSSFENLPNSVAKLEHLRVLDLRNNCKIRRLPHSICKLQNLQVLSVERCMKLETLPKGLGKLISLQKLFITTKQLVLPHNQFASLNDLRILGFFNCDNLKFLFSGPQQLTSLETLSVHSCGSLESLPLHCFPKLRTLFLGDCEILNLSLNNESPIQRLGINHLYLEHFPGLLTLPQWILGATYVLETLDFHNLPNLKMLPECLTTKIRLKRLYIRDCPQVLSLPSDMRRLTALEDLRIYGCPELCRKCRPQSGEYWPMISHAKRVFIGEPSGEEE